MLLGVGGVADAEQEGAEFLAQILVLGALADGRLEGLERRQHVAPVGRRGLGPLEQDFGQLGLGLGVVGTQAHVAHVQAGREVDAVLRHPVPGLGEDRMGVLHHLVAVEEEHADEAPDDRRHQCEDQADVDFTHASSR